MAAVPVVAGCAASREADYASPEELEQELEAKCKLTSKDLEGPYFERGAPKRAVQLAGATEAGVRLVVEGRLFGTDCQKPLAGYALDVWQADKDGNYYGGSKDGFRLRGKIVADSEGRYRFETILPGRYGDAAGIRPAHLHAKVLTPMGSEIFTTQLYFEGDPYLGNADYCTRAKNCNSADPGRHLRLDEVSECGRTPYQRAKFDWVLART